MPDKKPLCGEKHSPSTIYLVSRRKPKHERNYKTTQPVSTELICTACGRKWEYYD